MDKEIKKIYDTMSSLYHLVHKLEEESVRKSDFGDLSLTEINVLVSIGTGRPKTMTHVANVLEINVSSLTTAVSKLVKKGYVERLRDDRDRRIVRIGLTETGRQAVREHEAFIEKTLGKALEAIPSKRLDYYISTIDDINKLFMEQNTRISVKRDPYELKPVMLGTHKLEKPIVQAGMGMGIAGPDLASAVAREGGLGLIGTPGIGFGREGYDRDPVKANLEAIKEELGKAVKAAGGRGLIGVTVMWSDPHGPEYVKAAVKSGAQIIVTSGSLPKDLPKYCNDKKVALVPTISSARAASAIIRSWSQKYNRTPDGFILQGPYAGGLLGFKESQIYRAQQEWYRIIADVKAEIGRLENCPLIVGGGIVSRMDAETAYRYGADGFLMGTRFIATEECDAPEDYKRLYLNCDRNDVTIIKSPVRTSVRAMKNRFTDGVDGEGGGEYDMYEAVRKAIEGDYENGLVFCGANAFRIGKIVSVKDVFSEFI